MNSTALISAALTAHGLKLEDQGGNLWNWRKPLGNGLELFCCAEDGEEPDDASPCEFGVMLSGSEAIAGQTYATGAELAQVLNSATR